MTADSRIDERTLRELYLRPFETAVREGRTLGVMTAYNRLNGTWCSEHPLIALARDEWAFDGFVVTDWFSGVHTAPAARAGLDLEMPGPGRAYGPALAAAARAGDIDEAALDRAVEQLLGVLDRVGALDEPGVDQPRPPTAETSAVRATLHQAAVAATVLLRNQGVLPLRPDALGAVAVLGPNAARAQISGGGSAAVRAYRRTSPLQALRARLASVEVAHEPGCAAGDVVPVLDGTGLAAPDGSDGLALTWFAGDDWSGEVRGATTSPDSSLLFFGPEVEGLEGGPWSVRAEATYTPAATGLHRWTLAQGGRARLLLDGEVVLDGTNQDLPPGDAFFGLGSSDISVDLEMTAGQAHELTIELSSRDSVFVTGARIGCAPVVDDEAIGRAAEVASRADVAIVVVGSDDTWETEGRDRPHLHLPGDQDALVAAVAAANPNTVVVVNTGAPVSMPWRDDVAAIVQCWFGGQEMAPALAAVLCGDADPGGRLPTTFPERLEHTPAHGRFAPECNVVHYGEGVFIGYRWYDHRALPVAYPFGHGLSYTTIELSAPIEPPAAVTVGEAITLRVPVRNTGDRPGTEVLQCYVSPGESSVPRPPKELKAFAKVHLEPGEETVVELTLDEQAFAHWDLGDENAIADFEAPHGQSSSAGTLTGRSPGWFTEPGRYELLIARSSADVAHRVSIDVRAADREGTA